MSDHDISRRFALHRCADQCRELLKTAVRPELVAQLQQFAVEYDMKADHILHTTTPSPKSDLLEQARRHRMKAGEYRATCKLMRDAKARAPFRQLAKTYKAMARRLEIKANAVERRDREAG
jgi:hypothetical protein